MKAEVDAKVRSWVQEAYADEGNPEASAETLKALRELVWMESDLSPNSQRHFLQEIDTALAEMHHRSEVLKRSTS